MDSCKKLAKSVEPKRTKNQFDNYRAPYINYVLQVMENGATVEEKIVGVLRPITLFFTLPTTHIIHQQDPTENIPYCECS